MNHPDNLENLTFGNVTILKLIGRNKHYKTLWLCRCKCGKEFNALGTHIKNGHTKSCGCSHKGQNKKHGLLIGVSGTKSKRSRIYSTWCSMLARCSDKNIPGYRNYGGRGIRVCDRWKNSFQAFWDDMGDPPLEKQIDRIDNNGNYCKENCRWATRKEQARNKRSNVNVTINGKTQCLKAWCEELRVSLQTVNWRRQFGQSDIEALTTPRVNRGQFSTVR